MSSSLLLGHVSIHQFHCRSHLTLLSHGSVSAALLQNCDLSGCDLQEANLRGSNVKGAIFEEMLTPLHMSQSVR